MPYQVSLSLNTSKVRWSGVSFFDSDRALVFNPGEINHLLYLNRLIKTSEDAEFQLANRFLATSRAEPCPWFLDDRQVVFRSVTRRQMEYAAHRGVLNSLTDSNGKGFGPRILREKASGQRLQNMKLYLELGGNPNGSYRQGKCLLDLTHM